MAKKNNSTAKGATWLSPPANLMSRMGTEGKDFVYLYIQSYKCVAQFAMARASDASNMRGEPMDSWKLLISSDVAESINHTWGKYEAMSGKLMELAKDVDQGVSGIKGIIGDVKNGKTNDTSGGNSSTANNVSSQALTYAMGQKVGNSKIDASTVYQDSSNRQYTFEFEFVAFENAEKEVYLPIRRLMELSCADAVDNGVGIEFPNIFEISTQPGEVVHIKNCALISVQPTWKFPWKDGFPMNASVALTFMEIPPLYKKTLKGQSLVSVSSTSTKSDREKNESIARNIKAGRNDVNDALKSIKKQQQTGSH